MEKIIILPLIELFYSTRGNTEDVQTVEKAVLWTRLMPSGQSQKNQLLWSILSQHINSSWLLANGLRVHWIVGPWIKVTAWESRWAQLRLKRREPGPRSRHRPLGPLFSHPECLFWHKCPNESSVCPFGSRQLYKQVLGSHFLTPVLDSILSSCPISLLFSLLGKILIISSYNQQFLRERRHLLF